MSQSVDTAASMHRDPPELVSIVVPTHNEMGNVDLLASAIDHALAGCRYELIFVDDSTDETFARIEALAQRDPRVVGLRLSRRFGHQQALAAGLSHARGQVAAPRLRRSEAAAEDRCPQHLNATLLATAYTTHGCRPLLAALWRMYNSSVGTGVR